MRLPDPPRNLPPEVAEYMRRFIAVMEAEMSNLRRRIELLERKP